ncbi:MAG: serine hydrolase domain-containing protein [Chloroflexota bacterium]
MGKSTGNTWKKMGDLIEDLLVKIGVPGCSVGILQDGEIKTAGFGISNIEQVRPVSGNTLFQIGSITKTFTAVVAMKLVEQGKLDLHRSVTAYLPEFSVVDAEVSAQVTPYHLLTHTSGWDGDLFLDTGHGIDAIQQYVSKMADRKQIFPLGKYFSYNNAGFGLLGSLLETVSEKPLEELFREFIIDPLELPHVFFTAGEVISHDFVVGHHKVGQEIEVARPWDFPRFVLPMGAIVTTPSDLLEYAKCYLNHGKTPAGKQLLKPETIEAMFSARIPISKADHTSVGLSWIRRDFDGGYLVSHGGGTNGQVSQLVLLPELNFAFTIFTNGDLGSQVIAALHEFILKEFVGVEYALPTEINSTPEQLAKFIGTASRPGFKFHLKMRGEHLIGLEECTIGFPTEKDPPPPPTPPAGVGRCAEDRLIILDGASKDVVIDIFRDAEAKINFLRMGRMYTFTPGT